ncbi:uncharacterized protein KGF55_004792 [Candida pseudojiufengensis]|uniref:uncharacterized protein n=1 Tax=Candida pseudojiufengensis TaxID=497109 RepID=UPI0022258D49|nr:uncharacterized protein KGF55_004792 [Candida pseudojiufengensis]KAI5960069.1 hypothetical protein KGF55_004792 [Candida pseudojiufengensis]
MILYATVVIEPRNSSTSDSSLDEINSKSESIIADEFRFEGDTSSEGRIFEPIVELDNRAKKRSKNKDKSTFKKNVQSINEEMSEPVPIDN